jgi:hypothetical protein
MKLVFGNQPRTHWWCEVLSDNHHYYFYPISSFYGQRCNQSKGVREIDCFIEQEFCLIQPLGKQNGSKTSGILSMAEDSPMRAVSVSMMCTNLKAISHSYDTSVVAWAMEHILKLSINEGKNAQNWMHCCWVSLHFQVSLLYCSFTIYIYIWTLKQDQINIWNIVLQGICILEESNTDGKNIVDTKVTGIW